MSSHHIVKDFQEPALLIADGELCNKELIDELLQWSPMVVVLDEAMLKLKDWNFKIDYWLGDFDDIEPESFLDEIGQDCLEIIHAPDQNKTDLEKGIEFLISKGAKAINLCGIDGKRIDHTLANFSSISKYAHQVNIVVWNNYSKAYFIPNKFSKWFKEKASISLIPMPRATDVNSKGLLYELNMHQLEWGVQTSSSNESSSEGMVNITYKDGLIMLIEKI